MRLEPVYEYLGDASSVLNDRVIARCPSCCPPPITDAETVIGALATVSSYAARIDVAGLTATSAIVTYTNASNALKARIITITGSDIVFGAERDLAITGFSTSVSRLSDTEAVVVYTSAGNTVKGAVLTVSGTTVTAGAESTGMASAATPQPHVAPLSSTQVVVAYVGAAGVVLARVLDISGSAVTPASAATVGVTANESYVNLDLLSSTVAVVTYHTQSPASDIVGVVCTISGSTITPGSEYNISDSAATTSTSTDIRAIDSGTALVSWLDAGGVIKTVRIGVVGTGIYPGDVTSISALGAVQTMYPVSPTRQLLAWSDKTSLYPKYSVNSVGASGIVEGTATQIEATQSFEHTIDAVVGYKSLLVYIDSSNFLHGLTIQV